MTTDAEMIQHIKKQISDYEDQLKLARERTDSGAKEHINWLKSCIDERRSSLSLYQ